jgi:hypothetical protein
LVIVAGDGVTLIDDNAYPNPVRLIIWGLVLALSVTVTVPVLVPNVIGVKLTVITQFAPGARLLGQVLVCEKSPRTDTTMFVKFPVPVFVRVVV